MITSAIIFPVLIGIFKTEIVNLFKVWNIYRLRTFDADGNPSTSDEVQILCNATGAWQDATITYKFSLSAKKRGVYVRYTDGGREKIGFIVWSGLRKRKPPLDKEREQ